MMVVAVKTERKFSAGRPKLLFKAPSIIASGYGITPDGQRFVMIEEGEHSTPPTQLNIVLNWFEELKFRVPSGN